MTRMIVAVLALALGSSTLAAQAKPSMHPSREVCAAAVLSGNFSSYEPKNFGLKGKNPRPGTTVDSLRIERPGCFYFWTFQGWYWVSEDAGTMMLTCNGSICGLASCWNPAKEFFFPEPAPPAPSPQLAPMPRVGADTPVVKHLVSGQVGITLSGTVGFQPLLPEQTEVPYTVRKGGGLPWWGWILIGAGVGVGGYFGIRALKGSGDPFVATLPPIGGPKVGTRPPGG